MILFVCRYSEIMASARYRAYKWAERLASKGARTALLYSRRNAYQEASVLEKAYFIMRLVSRSRLADTIVFQKYLPPHFIWPLLKGKWVVLDYDDRIYGDADLSDSRSRFRCALAQADRIIVSVAALQDEAVNADPSIAPKLVRIPTLIDWQAFREPSRLTKDTSRFTIGWVGSSSGLAYLSEIERPLSRLFAEYPDRLRFVVVADVPYTPRERAFPVDNVLWSLPLERDYFGLLDVLLMPLDNSARAQAKAGFKAIQALAAGVPVVISDTGFNQELVRQGENGFLARTPDDFYTAIRDLLESDELRRQMRERAADSVARFDFGHWESAYFSEVLGPGCETSSETRPLQ
ncbi:MAG TPA: glycosyltransferase family 4 protein [Oscillatoriaceae cyanobacterium]